MLCVLSPAACAGSARSASSSQQGCATPADHSKDSCFRCADLRAAVARSICFPGNLLRTGVHATGLWFRIVLDRPIWQDDQAPCPRVCEDGVPTGGLHVNGKLVQAFNVLWQVPPTAACPECRQRNVFQGAIELRKLGETIANKCGSISSCMLLFGS